LLERWRVGGNTLAAIDKSGRLLLGSGTQQFSTGLQVLGIDGQGAAAAIGRWSADTSAPALLFNKNRGATVGSNTDVASGDQLGRISFRGNISGTYYDGAYIDAYVHTTPGANDMPGRLSILVSADGSATPSEIARFIPGSAANNYFTFQAVGTGFNSRLSVAGNNLVLGSGSALATNATDGHVMIPSCAGTPTGAPTSAAGGQLPMIYDTSANKIWFYNGSWRGVVVT
jgi:hypothetical protein